SVELAGGVALALGAKCDPMPGASSGASGASVGAKERENAGATDGAKSAPKCGARRGAKPWRNESAFTGREHFDACRRAQGFAMLSLVTSASTDTIPQR